MMTETLRRFQRKFPQQRAALLEAWKDDPGGKPEISGDKGHPEEFETNQEKIHGMDRPIFIYPVIETALWKKYGAPAGQHQQKVAGMMSEFSKVAASDHEKSFAW